MLNLLNIIGNSLKRVRTGCSTYSSAINAALNTFLVILTGLHHADIRKIGYAICAIISNEETYPHLKTATQPQKPKLPSPSPHTNDCGVIEVLGILNNDGK
jgi:hypothetical protein